MPTISQWLTGYKQENFTSNKRDGENDPRRPKRVRLPSIPEGTNVTGTRQSEKKVQLLFPGILNEKTFISAPNTLREQLELFYTEVALIPEASLQNARQRTQKVLAFIMSRLRVNKLDLVFAKEPIFTGSVFDGTAVVKILEADVLLPFEKGKCSTELLEAGYMCILPPRKRKRSSNTDKWAWAKSDDTQYISPIKVAKGIHKLIENAVKYPVEIPNIDVLPFNSSPENGVHISLVLKGGLTINIIPCILPEGNGPILTTRPYMYDENKDSDMLWRYCNQLKAERIMKMVGLADRGFRHKAFLILKALCMVEHTIEGLDSYMIKTILFLTLDSNIDTSPRWQRCDIETCFKELLTTLLCRLRSKKIEDFFVRGHNIIANIQLRVLASLTLRISHVLNNQNELVRIIKKRRF